ncbi:MAG: hypothetical protein KBF98_16330 [Rhodoferax sp.]|nr:hypothetical protein [Rhodoferax sp.]MBP9685666.1 hypothetical protein [Rhodoferax sp.]
MNTSTPASSQANTQGQSWLRPARLWAVLLAMGLGLGAIGHASDAPASPQANTAAPAASPAPTSVKIDDSSFRCIRKMESVRHFYVDNLLGDKAATLAAANNPKGAIYPAGSVVQLVPTEVMVKREAGFSPATGDWEFFELEVNDKGSKIHKRGFAEVNNRFGGNCFACHAPAREPWDFVCETGHGCEPIPIDHRMTGALQRSDPRCGPAQLQSGDTMALLKLRAMVMIGGTMNWFKKLF